MSTGAARAITRREPWLLDDQGGWSRRALLGAGAALARRLPPGTPVLLATATVRATVVGLVGAMLRGSEVWLMGDRLGRQDREALQERIGPEAVLLGDTRTRTPGARRVDDLLREDPRDWRPGRLGRLRLLTSGTTGTPSVVRRGLPTPASARQLAAVLQRSPVRPRRIALATPPTGGHGLATVLAAWAGSRLLDAHGMSAERLEQAVADGTIDAISAVPSQLADWPVLPLRLVVSGSDVLPAALVARWAAGGAQILNVYGTTETGPVATAGPRERARDPDTVGRALPGVSVRVVDVAGQPVPDGVEGVLEVRTPMLGGGRFCGDRGVCSGGLIRVTGRVAGVRTGRGEVVDLDRAAEVLRARPGVTAVRRSRPPEAPILTVDADAGVTATQLQAVLIQDLGPAYAVLAVRLGAQRD